jgi:hypothetical protein
MSEDGDVRRQTLKTSGCRKAKSLKGLKYVIVLGVMLCLSAAPLVSRAQGEPPPVLDPADIFTDAVEVVETLPVIRRTAELSPNNGQRILYYYNRITTETEAHPYPEGMEDIHDWETWTEGNYLLVTDSSSLPTITLIAAWIFSPDKGNFSRPEEACGFVKARPGTGVWILFQNPSTEVYHLCFTETGELGNPLPDELQPNLCDNFSLVRPTAISTDGEWIVFADCGDAFSVYAYRVETGQVWAL